jgi:hypothetical protein
MLMISTAMSVIMRFMLINVTLLILLHPIALDAKNFEYRLIQSNNIQRQELLQQKCDKYHLDNNEVDGNKSIHSLSEVEMEHLLIDRNHKFLYCYVPKVRVRMWDRDVCACQNWNGQIIDVNATVNALFFEKINAFFVKKNWSEFTVLPHTHRIWKSNYIYFAKGEWGSHQHNPIISILLSALIKIGCMHQLEACADDNDGKDEWNWSIADIGNTGTFAWTVSLSFLYFFVARD